MYKIKNYRALLNVYHFPIFFVFKQWDQLVFKYAIFKISRNKHVFLYQFVELAFLMR